MTLKDQMDTCIAKQKDIACRFVARDMTVIVEGFDNTFDFEYDWDVLHHVIPEGRER